MQKDQLFKSKITKALAITLLSLSFLIHAEPTWAQNQGSSTVLNGSASQSDIYSTPKPSLERSDIDDNADPFGSGGQEAFDAPDTSFQGQNADLGKPNIHDLHINQQGGGQMGAPGKGTPDVNMQPQQPIMPNNQQQQAQAQDPESVGQMKLAWDMWHKRVAEAIYVKYDRLAKMGFKRSRPLSARALYSVTRDGRIINVRLIQKSNNFLYNTMIFGVLKSMNGSSILAYPQGSRRTVVEKTGRFLWNVNNRNGFRYTTGDQETIQRQR